MYTFFGANTPVAFRSLRFGTALIPPSISNAVAFNTLHEQSFKVNQMDDAQFDALFSGSYSVANGCSGDDVRNAVLGSIINNRQWCGFIRESADSGIARYKSVRSA